MKFVLNRAKNCFRVSIATDVYVIECLFLILLNIQVLNIVLMELTVKKMIVFIQFLCNNFSFKRQSVLKGHYDYKVVVIFPDSYINAFCFLIALHWLQSWHVSFYYV